VRLSCRSAARRAAPHQRRRAWRRLTFVSGRACARCRRWRQQRRARSSGALRSRPPDASGTPRRAPRFRAARWRSSSAPMVRSASRIVPPSRRQRAVGWLRTARRQRRRWGVGAGPERRRRPGAERRRSAQLSDRRRDHRRPNAAGRRRGARPSPPAPRPAGPPTAADRRASGSRRARRPRGR